MYIQEINYINYFSHNQIDKMNSLTIKKIKLN